MKLLDIFGGAGRPVLFYPKVAEFAGGIPEGLFLAQLVYWYGHQGDKEGWLYKTQVEWEQETGLTRRVQQGARAALVSKGFLDEKYEGIPRQLYYKVQIEKLMKAWRTWMDSQPSDSVRTDAPNVHAIKGSTDDSRDDTENTDAAASARTSLAQPNFPGRMSTESVYDWFMRTWKTGTYRDKSTAVGAIFRVQFAKEPNYARLMKMAKDMGSGLRLFQFIMTASAQPISDDPHDYLAGMVSRELKRAKTEQQNQPAKEDSSPLPNWSDI